MEFNEKLRNYFSKIAPSPSVLDLAEGYYHRKEDTKNGIIFYSNNKDNTKTSIYRGIFKIEPKPSIEKFVCSECGEKYTERLDRCTKDECNGSIETIYNYNYSINASEVTPIFEGSNIFYAYSFPGDGEIKIEGNYSLVVGVAF